MLHTLTCLRQLRECIHRPGESRLGAAEHAANIAVCRGSSAAPRNPNPSREEAQRDLSGY